MTARQSALVILLSGYISIPLMAAQGMILVPLYLRHLGAGTYGAWLASGNILAWLAVLDAGSTSLMTQRMAAANGAGDRRLFACYYAVGLCGQLLVGSILILGALLLGPGSGLLSRLLSSSNAELPWCFVFAGVAATLAMLNGGVAAYGFATERPLFILAANFGGSVIGFGLSLLLLMRGFGLWSIPLGLIGCHGTALLLNGGYAAMDLFRAGSVEFRADRRVVSDLLGVYTWTTMNRLGQMILRQTDGVVLAVMLGPQAATLLQVTRRPADVLQMLLDRIGGASFPGFARLYGSGRLVRAGHVLDSIVGLNARARTVGIGAFLLLNHSFVVLWVGKEHFAGQLATVLIGFAVFEGCLKDLLEFLYGASGEVAISARIVLIEAVLRLALTLGSISVIGIAGVPAAALVTAALTRVVFERRLRAKLPESNDFERHAKLRDGLVSLVLITSMALIGAFLVLSTWRALIVVATLYTLIVAMAVIAYDLVTRGGILHVIDKRQLGKLPGRFQPLH